MTDKTNELKPCPFCGSEAEMRVYQNLSMHYNPAVDDDQPEYYVECKKCPVRTYRRARRSYATEIWNRRYDHAAAELREKVERLSQDEVLKWGREHPSDETGLYAQGWIDARKAIFTALTEPADNIAEVGEREGVDGL